MNRNNSRGLVVAEVDVEGGEAAGQEGAVAANLEVGALGTDAGTGGGIVEGASASKAVLLYVPRKRTRSSPDTPLS